MDPAAVVSLVFTARTLIRTLYRLAGRIRRLVKCPALVLEILTDANHFAWRLEAFQRVLEENPFARKVSPEQTKRILDDISRTLHDLTGHIAKVTKASDDNTEIQVVRYRFLQNETRLRQLRTQLIGHFEKVTAVIQLVQVYVVVLSYGQYQANSNESSSDNFSSRFLACVVSNPRILETCAPELGELVEEQERQAYLEAPRMSVGLSASSPPAPNPDFVSGHTARMASVSSNAETLVPSEPAAHQLGINSVVSTSSALQELAVQNCSCKCHSTQTNVSDGLRSMFEVHFSRLSPFLGRRCSNSKCCTVKKGKQNSVSIQIRGLQKALRVVWISRNLRTRYWPVQRPEVPEGADSMMFAKSGKLEGLKRLIKSRAATPFDTAPDGWTLLHVSIVSSFTASSR